MRSVKDSDGREWTAETVGRTSGLMSRSGLSKPELEPADIIRFTCRKDPSEAQREVTAKAGLFETFTAEELTSLLELAPKMPGA